MKNIGRPKWRVFRNKDGIMYERGPAEYLEWLWNILNSNSQE